MAATARSTPALQDKLLRLDLRPRRRFLPQLRLVDDDDGMYCSGDGELVADHDGGDEARRRGLKAHGIVNPRARRGGSVGVSTRGRATRDREPKRTKRKKSRRLDSGWETRGAVPARTERDRVDGLMRGEGRGESYPRV
ncbi:hypothetical protein F2Q69_00004767 [Brassica cretica]|uniref:Uncharacterized protein n=1 Tax=Brassica cretica TaxID=69181 RepID=A0A8S9PMF4_BRACR|nr:hypothetical protein F2Q69_00004767 [Brassica cretica]